MTPPEKFAGSNLRKPNFVLIAAIIALAPAMARAQFLHPKIAKKETTIRNVVILPAKVNVVRDSMKGPEGMAAESENVSGRVEEALSAILEKQKHVKTLNPPAAARGEGDAEQKYSIADFQTKFDDLLPRILKKRSDVKKGRFTMGDEVLNLNLDKSVDAIVFIRGQGQKLTGGKTAFVMLVGGAPAYLKMQIGIIDAHTGEVLLYTDPMFAGDPTTAIDRLRKALEKGFKKLPAATVQ
ncbi:MAG TPA: hypothetical protein VN696_15880 [Pyrinomonadaceae bacterium]|jgi:hypothetical protein|nr:hypothetical protein [Pyrinomonadaceae bacterium]